MGSNYCKYVTASYTDNTTVPFALWNNCIVSNPSSAVRQNKPPCQCLKKVYLNIFSFIDDTIDFPNFA